MTKKVQELTEEQKAAEVQANEETGQEKQDDKSKDAKPEQLEPVVEPELFNLSELAAKRRIPGWQQAALLRLMDWQKDKLVTEAEYDAALKALGQRRLGGGRM